MLRKQQADARLTKKVTAVQHRMDGGEKILLTPDMAMALLEKNKNNRPITDGHVRRIAAQIKNGKWRYNGDTIKIATTDDVLDGQHRCWAVIEAQMPIDTIIVYGIEPDAFSTIDTLRKLRSGSDVLALNGQTRYRNIISSALQWLLRYQRKVLPQWKSPQNRIENSDIEEAWAAHPQMAAAVERAMQLRSITNPSVLGFIYYVLSNRNEEIAERLMKTLENPAAVGVNDPFYKLREYFKSESYKRKEPLYTIALAFKAANAAHQGKDIKHLHWKNQGVTAEPFPVLDVGRAKSA